MRALEAAFLIAIAAVALVFFPSVSNPFALKQEWALFLISGALSLRVYEGRSSRLTGALGSRPAHVAVLLVLAAAASNLTARNAPESWVGHSLLALGAMLFLFGHLRLWSPAFPRRFAQVVCWTSLPVAALGITQALLPGKLDFGLQALGRMAPFATLGNPLFVAAWLVFAIPLYPAVAAAHRGIAARIGTATVALAAVACLIATRSSSGALALAATGLAAVGFRTSRAAVRRGLVAVGLLIPVVAVYLGLSTHTGRGRIMIWTETVLIWMQHPWFGVGLGQFNLHQVDAQHRFFALGEWTRRFDHNAAFVLDAHNQYLQVLAEQGLLGFGLFLFLVFVILRRAGRRVAHDPLVRGFASGWCGLLVLFLWNAPLFYAPILMLFWTTAGILAPITEPTTILREAPRSARRLAWLPPLLVCAAGALFWAKLRAGTLEKEGDALLERGPFAAAADRYRAALRWAPQNGYAWEKLALAQYFAGDYGAALRSLEAARDRFGDVGILYLEAEILTRRKDYDRAIGRFEFIRDAFPQHVTPSFALGQIFREQGDYARAEREFVRVLGLADSRENLKLDRRKVAIQKTLAFRFLAEIRRRPGVGRRRRFHRVGYDRLRSGKRPQRVSVEVPELSFDGRDPERLLVQRSGRVQPVTHHLFGGGVDPQQVAGGDQPQHAEVVNAAALP